MKIKNRKTNKPPFETCNPFHKNMYIQTFEPVTVGEMIDKMEQMDKKIDGKVDNNYSYQQYQYNKV